LALVSRRDERSQQFPSDAEHHWQVLRRRFFQRSKF
jgi:hypothetical protein